MTKLMTLAATVLLTVLTGTLAEARQHRHHSTQTQVATGCVDTIMQPCYGQPSAGRVQTTALRSYRDEYRPPIMRQIERPARVVVAAVSAGVQMLAHPSGCPSRAFCGCGAAVDLGLNPRTHMLAASYFRYPPASPAPNMVAVRSHHVFVLKQQLSDGQWLVADYNSGGHASRLHVRSLSGYSIRNPHA